MTRVRTLLLLAGACAGLASAAAARDSAAADTAGFAYVYVVPNSGGSSGGHAAICFDATCFHFQQVEEGRIRLRRDDFEQLDFEYRVLGNRTLHLQHVTVERDLRERMRRAFERRLARESRMFRRFARLHDDRILLDALIDGTDRSRELPSAGYFLAEHDTATATATSRPAAPWLVALRNAIARHYGDRFLESRADALRAGIVDLVPDPADQEREASGGFAADYFGRLSALVAVDVLLAGSPLQPGVLVDAGALTAAERAHLKARASRLRDNLVDLFDTLRPDRGQALLIGMARLAAVDASLASGRLLLLDPLGSEAPRVSAKIVERHREAFASIAAERRADFVRLRADFFADGDGSEARWSLLEVAATLANETQRGVELRRPIRLHQGWPLPLRGARRDSWPQPSLGGLDKERARSRMHHAERVAASELDRSYKYDLFERNCVTELLRTMYAARAETDPGFEAPEVALSFVPFRSTEAIERAYPSVAHEERPSRRLEAVAAMTGAEPAWRVALREENVLTARAYRTHPQDPAFLLFTDRVFWLRPLFGVANLAYAAVMSAAGIPASPFDRGERMRSGLEGLLYGVPELAMFDLRRGTYPFAPRSRGGEPPKGSAPVVQGQPSGGDATTGAVPDRRD